MSRYPEPFFVKWFPFGRFVFRFMTGRPLDGIRRTDSIFIRPGKKSLDTSGWATPWALLAGYQRLLVRLGGTYVLAWLAALAFAALVRGLTAGMGMGVPAWAAGMTPTRVLVDHLIWSLVLGGPVLIYLWVRTYGLTVRYPDLRVLRTPGTRVPRVSVEGWVPWTLEGRRGWDRRYVRPLALAADNVLGTYHHPRKAGKWVQVPRNFRHADGAPVVIQLPANFTGSDKGSMDRLARAAAARLGLRDPDVKWDLEGDRPRVLFSAPPLPPSFVAFAEVREFMEALPEYEMFLGVAARRANLTAHLVGESPHIAISAGPGAGKSELIKNMIMQVLRWGWGVVILDWKEVSHAWADGLPGVLYVRDIEDIHNMCVRLGQEVDTRKALYRRDPDMPGKAKVLVVAEEMNVTASLLSSYWESLRQTAEPEEKRTMPTKSPAIQGLMAVNFGGRQFSMFMAFVAQRFSAKVTNGNADLRESFQIRLLARCSVQTQKMLAGHIKPFPKMGVQPGRWCAVIGQEAVQYQAAWTTDEEAREFAQGGLENPSSPLTGLHRPAVPNREDVSAALGDHLGDGLALPSQRQEALAGDLLTRVDARKLSDMTDVLSHLGVTLEILRHATKDTESGFPLPYGGSPNRGYTYDFKAVQEWARHRHASRAAEREVRR